MIVILKSSSFRYIQLSEAKAIQTDTLSEVNRLNETLAQFYDTLSDTDSKMTEAHQNVTLAADSTAEGANITGNIQIVMIEASGILHGEARQYF